MGNVQKLDIEGKAYVLMPEDEYQDLLDVNVARDIMARVKAGEETWPIEIVKALAEGENRIRVFRKYRGLTISALAEKAGLTQPYISEIETGKKAGSFDAMKAIAEALDLSLDDLA
jgi:DNA-binding XRE family transcriptional regulator